MRQLTIGLKAPPVPAVPKRKRVWLRRLGWTSLTLFLLLALFHRPLVFRGTKYFVIRLAKEQKLDLRYTMGGSIFTTLTITDLEARPTESGPVEQLKVGALNLRYSLIGLARHGLPGLLKEVDLREAFVVIDPAKVVPREKPVKEQKGGKFPALFPERLNLANLNFISRSSKGDTKLAGFYFSFDPEKPGALRIETLDLPGVRRWDGIAGVATFRERVLLLSDLAFGPEIALKTLRLDVSKLDDNAVSFGLDGAFVGAPLSLTLQVTGLNDSNRLDLQVDASSLDFAKAANYVGAKSPVQGALNRLVVRFAGVPEQPASWAGTVEAQLGPLALDQQPLGSISARVSLGDGRGKAVVDDNYDAQTKLSLNAEFGLPQKLADFAQTDATGRLEVLAPDLATLTKTLPQTAAGDLAARLDFKMAERRLAADLALDSAHLTAAGVEMTGANFAIHLEKDLRAPAQPAFAALTTKSRGTIANLRFGDYTAESLAIALSSREGAVTLEKLALKKAANSLALEASGTLPDDLKSWAGAPVSATIDLAAPDLSAFLIPGSNAQLAGGLTIRGGAQIAGQKADGAFSIAGRAISFRGVTVRDVSGDVNIVNRIAHLPNFGIYFDAENFLNLGVKIALDAPRKYNGWTEVKLGNLAAFAPLLAAPDKPATALAGALALSWRGSGELAPAQHSGGGNLDLTRGKFGAQENLSAHLAANYSPQKVTVSELRATAAQGELQTEAQWENRRLRIQNLAVRRANRVVLSGALELPLDPAQASNPDLLIPDNVPVAIALTSRDLDLAWLFGELAKLNPPKTVPGKKPGKPEPPPVTGTLNTTITADGTLQNLVASVSVRGTKLQAAAAQKVAPADIALDLNLRDDRLKLSGSVNQREIKPLTLSGDLPLDLAAMKKAKSLDPQTPIALRVNLPRSSLGFLPTLVPALRFINGTAALDLQASGTISQPLLAGSAQADIPNLRMKDASLPPLNSVSARIDFAGKQVNVRQLRAGLGGGSLSASGGVNLEKPDAPVLDLRITSREALVMQNDNLSLRVTSDLRIAGPMNAGVVSGSVFLTRGRFFKDIDILPIGLPGRPAPQPPAEPAPVSFPNAPLRDWRFDIAIKTSDPFLIQGNLANGRAAVDLKLSGTGLKPWLDGSVRIEELMTSLPFSRLEITTGNIYFTAAKPFVPQLDIRGESVIRDYTVNLFLSGEASKPEALFTSDPPLPQAEIVSLIATGATTQELTGDPNALAGRAGLLVAQKLFRKVFRKKETAQPKETPFKNVQFDVGAPDPHSGQQSVQLRVPMGERVVLTGGVDVGGNFRGQLRYLVKFK